MRVTRAVPPHFSDLGDVATKAGAPGPSWCMMMRMMNHVLREPKRILGFWLLECFSSWSARVWIKTTVD